MSTRQRETLFRRLTKLFKSGPVVKRKVKQQDTRQAGPDPDKSSAVLTFQKSYSPIYNTIVSNAFNLSERLARYQDFNSMEMCLMGDTQIAIPGGFKTIAELAQECTDDPDKEFVVYAYDHNKSAIVPALAKQARQTCVEEAWEVTFDNGKKISGTGNHRLLKRDGTFCEIQNLRPGDAMMPFNRVDLRENTKFGGYRWIYTIAKDKTRKGCKTGWTSEHRLIASWMLGRDLENDEVVHHRNFVRHDNRPENLQVMKASDHTELHRSLGTYSGKKCWAPENSEWIERFKKNHSKFMAENNPATRHDITFGRVLEVSEKYGFDLNSVCRALDCSGASITTCLQTKGYNSWYTFVHAYTPKADTFLGANNGRYRHDITIDAIYSKYKDGQSLRSLCKELKTGQPTLRSRLCAAGYTSFADFKRRYKNCKVVSVVKTGNVVPMFDLTVDGYKNFATDSVISHNTPEISKALDLYADESVAQDDVGRTLHIYSDNPKVKGLLEELFYDTLNVEFNLRPWVRNLVKYGDLFLFNDVHPRFGLINVIPIPVNELEREEGFDREDPTAVRFRWTTMNNNLLENWQVTHIRLMSNDMFLPYGTSMIESARKIWRQLMLIEDAMLVYRVVRAPERRVFYIDVGNTPNDEVPNLMEQARMKLRTSQVIDQSTSRVDVRYNPLSVDEDYFIPRRGAEGGTKIETLAGGQNTAAVEDVQYIQRKLFAALGIPKAYLGYDEMLSSKATLAQEDIRFSRTVNMIQRTLISELNKMAIIHLAAHGFDGEDLLNFRLHLSNPSTVAQQQKLELYRTKFEIAAAGQQVENLVDMQFLRKKILGLTDEEIDEIKSGQLTDAEFLAGVEAGGEGGGGGGLGGGGGGGGGGGPFGDEDAPDEEGADTEDEPEKEEGDDVEPGVELIRSGDDDSGSGKPLKISIADPSAPLKTKATVLGAALTKRRRKKHHGNEIEQRPDFLRMTSMKGHRDDDPFDMSWIKTSARNPLGEGLAPTLSWNLSSMIDRMAKKIGIRRGYTASPVPANILSEGVEDVEIDINIDGEEQDDSYDGDT
jgi:hypothetical protein